MGGNGGAPAEDGGVDASDEGLSAGVDTLWTETEVVRRVVGQ